jgi:hypothetical protein
VAVLLAPIDVGFGVSAWDDGDRIGGRPRMIGSWRRSTLFTHTACWQGACLLT